jgi:hypothetical protein
MDLNKVVPHSDFHISGASDTEASRPNSPPRLGSTRRRAALGLLLRKGIWHIDKVMFGRRICESTQSSDLNEAAMLLAHRVGQARRAHLYGEPRAHIS